MNKKEVAERLNVSTRLVEKYAAEGRLGEVKYVRGRTGKQADFDDQAVEKLKEELESPVYPVTALQAPNRHDAGLIAPQERERFIHALEALGGTGTSKAAPTITDLAVKHFLTLEEASALSGLSRDYLSKAIKAKKLKAKIIGRGWKIKPTDLKTYTDKL
jgi:excisionase family DNA binding protein